MGIDMSKMPKAMQDRVTDHMGRLNLKKARVAPDSYRLTLPWPPTVNHYYQRTKVGMIVGKRGKAYRAEVCLACRGAVALDGRLKVTVLAYPPDKRKRDMDNLFKALLDAVQHAGVYHDDNQIDVLHIERRQVIQDGQVIVQIEKLKG